MKAKRIEVDIPVTPDFGGAVLTVMNKGLFAWYTERGLEYDLNASEVAAVVLQELARDEMGKMLVDRFLVVNAQRA